MANDRIRQPAQTGVTIVVAVFVFVICALGSAVVAAYHRDKIEKLTAFVRSLQKPAPAVSLPPPRSAKRDRVTRRLILTDRLARRDVLVRGATFSQADAFAETDFCEFLKPAFPDLKLEWQANAFFSDTSDCTAELIASPATDETVHNSLFIQIRRNIAGASTAVRLKIVTVQERNEQTYDPEFDKAADLVLGHLLTSDAAQIMTDIRARKPFNLETRGISIKFFEEQLSPGAFNLMVEARCGKFQCQASNPYYKLNQPVVEAPPVPPLADVSEPQQE